ncbi:GNAT family N-acetyltransferase [Tenacibaculum sp. Bg11-29]|uniref:GNAT family N-acetyltransferase n=1 Tax=Tenacibaculum sp. Bg11-29 TaxID=2058306 RepID=UPI001E6027DB|nr:GNAT family protein [Tenacibaculum sp. Bg11-29]
MMHLINETIFEKFPELESERLLFKEYRKEDAASLLYIRSHPKVSKYMDSEILKTVEDSEKRIHNMQQIFKEQNGITWAIRDKETNTLIGDFGVWKLDRQNSRGEIGYVLNPDYWGKGYMKESMISLINFAFNILNLHSLEANINPKNENSKKALLKFNFKQEAYFRENYYFDGKFLDSEIYSLLESDMQLNS